MEIKTFANLKLGEIRIALGENGETQFCLLDVCKILGLANPSMVKGRLDQAGLSTIEVCSTSVNQYGNKSVRTSNTTYISEANLYRCIFQSRKEEAKMFQEWMFGEVLPQIRRTGGYIPVKAEDDEKTLLAKALGIMKRTLEEKERLIEEQRPMAELGMQVTGSQENIMVGEMAKLLHENGIDIGRQRLFNWLRDNGYILKSRASQCRNGLKRE